MAKHNKPSPDTIRRNALLLLINEATKGQMKLPDFGKRRNRSLRLIVAEGDWDVRQIAIALEIHPTEVVAALTALAHS